MPQDLSRQPESSETVDYIYITALKKNDFHQGITALEVKKKSNV